MSEQFERPPDLAGDLSVEMSDQHAYFMADNLAAIRVTQQLQPAVKYAAMVPVSREVLADAPTYHAMMQHAVDRYLRPWTVPDRIAWPQFVPAPRLAAAVDAVARIRRRVVDAWETLRYGRHDEDDW